MAEDIVEVRELSRQFGDRLALDQVSYAASEGRVYGLVGVNGAGKTTLIKHMLGLLRAQSGSVRVFGEDPTRHPVHVLGQIGYLSEERDLPDWMTIHQLMRYTRGYYAGWDEAYANELLTTFRLDSSKKIGNLSKGMRAQAGLVSAVAHRPRLLVLDEPSSGLDAVVREDILNAILRTVSDEGRTVVFSSHLLDEVERMSDHITMINGGQVVLDGELADVREKYRRTTLQFAERPEMQPSIEGALSIEDEGEAWVAVHDTPLESFREAAVKHGASIVATRQATLLEIFIARVGRNQRYLEAPI